MLKVAILQSCYIPWKGYFDILGAVDHFMLFDDVQYARRHWHNRNRIQTAQGPIWLTIPVNTKGNFHQNIDEVVVSEPWAQKHWKTIQTTYARAPFMDRYRDWLGGLYEEADRLERLSEINALFIRAIAKELRLDAAMTWSSEYPVEGRKTDRLLALCQAVGATSYLSGPSARTYLEEDKFSEAGIGVCWMDYSDYPEYPQMKSPFEHGVSAIDLILNTGPDARDFMKPARRPMDN